ncbi:S1C family serine protease [Carboxydothermus ferrireducens]|uniref:Serine protease Do n=1 Tax=Carboxydothermus ferrireducens DSM 11255 TaxID=1119529 RepID=A0ABX2R7J0_9THEO|nr:trypsin-like peptidase domain-containing protein [Carboxydothermus ferrireducens]NYE56527.1 serine protease Do [Carboxydothermus ferrireducens DSM 11255]
MYQYRMDEPRGHRPSWFTVIVVAVIAGLIGSMAGIYAYPKLFPAENTKIKYTLPQAPEVKTGEYSYTPVVAVAKKVSPAVVGISNIAPGGFFGLGGLEEKSSGSGFIISPDGYIVTNNHVVEGAYELYVSLADGRQMKAKIIGTDPRADLAVIKVNAKNLPVVTLGHSSTLQVGELAIAIGNPLGKEFARSVTVGVISALNRTLTYESGEKSLRLIQTDAAINPGNSGGPLCNAKGEVVGINSAKISIPGFEGMGFAIPIDEAKPIIEQLINKGYVTRPWLGIAGAEISEQEAQYYDIPQGIYIEGVVEGGPADKAGIQAKDIITAINGTKITTMAELTDELFKHKPGEKIKVEVYRLKEGKKYTLEVTLGEKPRE